MASGQLVQWQGSVDLCRPAVLAHIFGFLASGAGRLSKYDADTGEHFTSVHLQETACEGSEAYSNVAKFIR